MKLSEIITKLVEILAEEGDKEYNSPMITVENCRVDIDDLG